MIKQKYAVMLFIAIFLSLLLPGYNHAQPTAGSEYQVKAGFIYHFARFTHWLAKDSANKKDPFIICIASTYPETESLFSLQKKVLKKQRLIVKKYESNAEIETCRILFIASDDKKFILKKLDDVKEQNVLTIGEEKEFAEMGGIISFFVEKNRLRFAVNLKAASRAGLKFSAQLLMSAEIIHEEP